MRSAVAVLVTVILLLFRRSTARGTVPPTSKRLQRRSPLQVKLRKALTVLLPSRLHVDSPEMYEFAPFDPLVPHHWAGWYWHFPPPDWDTPWVASREMLRGMIDVVHAQMRDGDFEGAADVLEDMGNQFPRARQRPSTWRSRESRGLFGSQGVAEVPWETFDKDAIRYIDPSAARAVQVDVARGTVTQSVDLFRFVVNATQLDEARDRRKTFLLSQAPEADDASGSGSSSSESASALLADRLMLDTSLLEALEGAEVEETESSIVIRQTMTPLEASRFLVRAGQALPEAASEGGEGGDGGDVADAEQWRGSPSPLAASMAAAALAGQLRRSPPSPLPTTTTTTTSSSSSGDEVAETSSRRSPPPGIPFWYWQIGDHCDFFVDMLLHPVETYKNFCFIRSRTLVGLRSHNGEPPEMRGAVAGTALTLGALLALLAAQDLITSRLFRAAAAAAAATATSGVGRLARAGAALAPRALGLSWLAYEVWMLFCTPLWGYGKVMRRAERVRL